MTTGPVDPVGVGVTRELGEGDTAGVDFVHAAAARTTATHATIFRTGLTSGASYANRETARASPPRASGSDRGPALTGGTGCGRGPRPLAPLLDPRLRPHLRVPRGTCRRDRRLDSAGSPSAARGPRRDPRPRRQGRERRLARGYGERDPVAPC